MHILLQDPFMGKVAALFLRPASVVCLYMLPDGLSTPYGETLS